MKLTYILLIISAISAVSNGSHDRRCTSQCSTNWPYEISIATGLAIVDAFVTKMRANCENICNWGLPAKKKCYLCVNEITSIPRDEFRRKRFSNETEFRDKGVEYWATYYENMYGAELVNDPNTAVNTYVVRNSLYAPHVELPYVLRARIYPRHLRARDPRYPSGIEQYMINMGAFEDDDRGHLLASSLSGPTQLYNFAPQSSALNRNIGRTAWWKRNEDEIRRGLRSPGIGSYDVTIVMGYRLNESNRPFAFGFRAVPYDSMGNIIPGFDGDCYFDNDPNHIPSPC